MRLILSLLILTTSTAFANKVALSFDDGLNPSQQPLANTWNHQILSHLKHAKAKAIFFVAGSRVNSTEGLTLVKQWGEQGHQIANHSYSHHFLPATNITLEDYLTDIEKNENLLKGFPGWTKRFRYPYLKEGNTRLKRDGVRHWLQVNGYATGAVSIDASDWYYDQQYRKLLSRGVNSKITLLREAYLAHLWDRATYYNELSTTVLSRQIDHVLLLHVNAINAAFLGDVVAMFNDKGWSIISPEMAYQDPVYQSQTNVLPAGESILWSLAKQQGIAGLRYPAEDSRYEKAKLEALLL